MCLVHLFQNMGDSDAYMDDYGEYIDYGNVSYVTGDDSYDYYANDAENCSTSAAGSDAHKYSGDQELSSDGYTVVRPKYARYGYDTNASGSRVSSHQYTRTSSGGYSGDHSANRGNYRGSTSGAWSNSSMQPPVKRSYPGDRPPLTLAGNRAVETVRPYPRAADPKTADFGRIVRRGQLLAKSKGGIVIPTPNVRGVLPSGQMEPPVPTASPAACWRVVRMDGVLTMMLTMREGVLPVGCHLYRKDSQYEFMIDFQCVDPARAPQQGEAAVVILMNRPAHETRRLIETAGGWMA